MPRSRATRCRCAPRPRARPAQVHEGQPAARASARAGGPRTSARSSRGARVPATDGARSARVSAPAASRRRGRTLLQVAAERLLALDGLEQRLEVAVTEASCAVPLDHLEEHRRPILRGLREDLKQVAVVVAVGEDLVLAQVRPVLGDLADAVADVLVVRVGRVEEEDPALLQRLDGRNDVLRGERDVLRAGAAVELDVFLDLALALPLGRLVDWKLDQ